MSIRIDAVSKSYKGTQSHAVDNVTLEVRDGEFMVLVGPSGCGKSTLLKLIAGIEEVSGGRIFIGDRDVTDLDPRKRDIAMVFQSYALYPHLTVRANLNAGRKYPRPLMCRPNASKRWMSTALIMPFSIPRLQGGQAKPSAVFPIQSSNSPAVRRTTTG